MLRIPQSAGFEILRGWPAEKIVEKTLNVWKPGTFGNSWHIFSSCKFNDDQLIPPKKLVQLPKCYIFNVFSLGKRKDNSFYIGVGQNKRKLDWVIVIFFILWTVFSSFGKYHLISKVYIEKKIQVKLFIVIHFLKYWLVSTN